ncbi:MAG: hypothetical protein B6240_01290 [Desulfobacteraceae bacterium 4572_87]|nr:MAG: hypothetical protein B6240_01290 [Desulfobacteraceae bacterium 4572_87]
MRKCFLCGILLMAFLLSACAMGPTVVTVRSNPTGAQVVLKDVGISAITDGEIKISDKQFEQGNPDKEFLDETFVFTLDGYRKRALEEHLQKHVPGDVFAKLSKIDTKLTIKSEPPGALVTLGCRNEKDMTIEKWEKLLPEDWSPEFTTPKTFVCTSSEAREIEKRGVYIKRNVELDGYLPIWDAFENSSSSRNLNKIRLAPGRDTTILIPMKPIITRLQVISNPPGAIVEDINDGGFGYIGETPLIRNFNWEDVQNWRAKQSVKRGEHFSRDGKLHPNIKTFSAMHLNLRISKAGFDDVYLKNLRIPIGQERAFRKDLMRLASQINFASDPQGVHVYVERELDKEVYDEGNNRVNTVQVEFKKHLGTTPFTLNIDPNDPIRHGEKLIFEKSGYVKALMYFASGNDSYHQVMTPEKVKER